VATVDRTDKTEGYGSQRLEIAILFMPP